MIIIINIHPGSATHPKVVFLHPIELEFENVDFCSEVKTGEPGEKPRGAELRTNNQLNTLTTTSSLLIVFFSLTSEKLSAYNLGEEIGQGGFGSVFSGTRKVDNLPVSTVHELLTMVSLEYNKASED